MYNFKQNILIISVLGLFDTLFLTTQFTQVGLRHVECDVGFHLNPECKGNENFQWFIRSSIRVLNFLSPFAYTCSIYLIILVTIERYIIICHTWVSSKPFLASSSNIWPRPRPGFCGSFFCGSHLSTALAWRETNFQHFFFYKCFRLVLGLLKSRMSKNLWRALGEI